jgi:hypothetical protein
MVTYKPNEQLISYNKFIKKYFNQGALFMEYARRRYHFIRGCFNIGKDKTIFDSTLRKYPPWSQWQSMLRYVDVPLIHIVIPLLSYRSKWFLFTILPRGQGRKFQVSGESQSIVRYPLIEQWKLEWKYPNYRGLQYRIIPI